MNAAQKIVADKRNALCACESCIRLEGETVERFRRVLERAEIALERSKVIGGRFLIAEANGAVRRAAHAVEAAERRLDFRRARRKPPEREVFNRLALVTDACATIGCPARVNSSISTVCYDCRRKQQTERNGTNAE